MKDSGIEWIGEIPDEWELRRLFQVSSPVKNPNIGLQDVNLLSLSYGKIKRKNIDTVEGLLPESFEGYNIIEENDIVLRLTDLQNDQKSLRVGHVNERGIITSAYCTIRPKGDDYSRYLYYYLHSFDIVKGFYGMGAGIRQGLNWKELKSLSVLIPPLLEQKIIADFLDKECAEIDSLAEKNRESIEEYKKLKQAVITEAVTKGVRGKREMKDSGVEWVGEIPNAWCLCKLKYLVHVKDGTHETPLYVNELGQEAFPLITSKNIVNNQISFENVNWIAKADYIHINERSNVEINDIIMPMIGTIGNPALVETNRLFSIKNLALFKTSESCVNPKIIFYILCSDILLRQFDVLNRGGVQSFVSLNILENLIIPNIPKEEQQEIADYLDKKTAEIDALIAKKEALLEELDAYKKSLIYEYVTGKKRVSETAHT